MNSMIRFAFPSVFEGLRKTLAACLLLWVTALIHGQTNGLSNPSTASSRETSYIPTLTFDVYSIRECKPGPQSNGFNNPLHSGNLTGKCDWASQLIGWAYGLDYRLTVVGGPDWVLATQSNEVRFDLEGKSDIATNDKLAKLTDDEAMLEKQHMLQALLADRFKLKVHMETREQPAFALTITKHGYKL